MNRKKAVYACDIGGSKLLCGFVTEDGRILDTERTALAPDTTADVLETLLEAHYTSLKKRNSDVEILGCGMTIPGLADPKSGLWVYACFSGISDYPVKRRMEDRLDLPVRIENDVNACAWAEKVYGGCRDCDDFLWVTVSNGVGGGLVLNGKIYGGAFGGGGEFGHIVVEDSGRTCPCGHKGCLEAMAAGPGISARYEALAGTWRTGGEIASLARSGDPAALHVLHDTGTYIGKALGKAASLLNLRKYVLGGGVMQSYDLMAEEIHAAFRREAFERPNAKAEICLTNLGYNAALLGAAAIFFTEAKNT